MNCEACRDAVNSDSDKRFVDAIHEVSGPTCDCENCSLSEYSPGPVGPDEILNFVLTDPGQVFADGTLRPHALLQIDRGGLSILRDAASDDEFLLTAEEMTTDAGGATNVRYLFGVTRFAASAIRSDDSGQRVVCIYDTGLERKPHHGDVAGPSFTGTKSGIETLQKKRRKWLSERIMSDIHHCSTFRGGLLAGFGIKPSIEA